MIGLPLLLLALTWPPDGPGPAVAEPTDFRAELRRMDDELAGLREAVEAEPADPLAVARHAALLERRASLAGDLAGLRGAEAAIDEGLRRVGPLEDLYLLRAYVRLKLHRVAEARADLDRAPHLDDSPMARTLRADLAQQEGRPDEARAAYEALIRDHGTWDVLARLAHLRAKAGDFDEADRLYARAADGLTAKQMRSFAWVELQRGLLDLRRGRLDEARAHYELARRAYSGYWVADEHLAEVLAMQGESDAAIALYEDVLARVPRPELQQALGDLHDSLGRPDLAKPWHDRALAGYLESAGRGEVHYYHHLADFFADVRLDGDEALKWARRDFELRPSDDTRAMLAWALHRAGRADEAVAAVEEFLRSDVRDAHQLRNAAAIYEAAGRVEEATRLRAEAAAINPRPEGFHVHR